jgi:hypothetical protein
MWKIWRRRGGTKKLIKESDEGEGFDQLQGAPEGEEYDR